VRRVVEGVDRTAKPTIPTGQIQATGTMTADGPAYGGRASSEGGARGRGL